MKQVWVLTLCLTSSGCGNFFDELPLGEGAADTEREDSGSGTQGDPGPGSDNEGPGKLDCSQMRSDCPSQDLLRACDDKARTAKTEMCQQSCGQLTAVTCWAQRDGSGHGCWCEGTGQRNLSGCAGLLACVERCGGPDQNQACTSRCFERTDAVTARVYGALVHCAQSDCAPICQAQPAACAPCIEQTMAGTVGSCASLRTVCAQDRGSDDPLFPQ